MSTKNNRIAVRAIHASIFAAIIIIIAKSSALYLTNSTSILATLVDSFLDLLASSINVIAINYALQPPDNEHRFGHSRAEDLAALIQAIIFCLSGVFVLVRGIGFLIKPTIIEHESIGIVMMLFSIVITSALLLYQRYIMRKSSSIIVKCDHIHYVIDLLTNCLTIFALYCVKYFHITIFDSLSAIFIAFYMIYGASKLILVTFNNLMDHELPDDQKKKLIKLIKSDKEIISIHDLKTRIAGQKLFVQFHVVLNGQMPLRNAHSITERIENRIAKIFKNVEIIIHQDPHDIEEEKQFNESF